MKTKITVAIFTLLPITSCKGKKEYHATATIAPVTEAVFAPGHIESVHQFTLTAFYDGYIRQVMVTEGDEVKAGQILFKQDNTTSMIQQRAATENLQISQQQAAANSAVLQQLQAQLISAQQTMQTNKAQNERMQRLYTTHSVAKVDVDNAQLAYENAVNNVAGITQNIAATKLNLQQTVVNSRSQQETAIANTNYYNLSSPGNYTIYSLLKKAGDLVKKGEAVATMGNADMMVVMNIDETSITKVQLHQKVLVELNTQKGTTYTANVSKIYPQFDDASQSYKVEATFDSIPPGLINGTLLQANIIVAHKDKALLIPRACLRPDNKVVMIRDKRRDTIAIQTGIVSTDWVEVLKGVSTTDQLIKAY
ncbi:efflux RND transporter periplasmic adaptor subunit [Chitinophaga sp. 30R24]|uniref:efflux RND transporter periplasmic adaptor subunit n=1 Tax=Chitinophaga sp. 30R24 TaxID=3248838 RepID=UPI003B91CCFF